jgi:hypothetical protein
MEHLAPGMSQSTRRLHHQVESASVDSEVEAVWESPSVATYGKGHVETYGYDPAEKVFDCPWASPGTDVRLGIDGTGRAAYIISH